MACMKNKKPDTRPVNLNLLKIRQPVTAIASIGHRISGVFLFLSIPFVIWLLGHSLQGPQGFADVGALLDKGVVKLMVLMLTWSVAHHFFAGIRFLLMDIDIGIELATARTTAMVVNVLGVCGALIAMAMIL